MIFALVLWLFLASPALAATDFDGLTLRDACGRTEDPLSNGGQWSNLLFSADTSRIEADGNFCIKDATTGNGSTWWNAATFGPDTAMVIEVNDSVGTGVSKIELFVRIANPGAGAMDGYGCYLHVINEDILLTRYDDNTQTVMTTCATLSATVENDDQFACEIIGSTLKAYMNYTGSWVEECSVTDSTYSAAGYVGMQMNKADVNFDNIKFDTLESGASPTQGQGLWPFMQ